MSPTQLEISVVLGSLRQLAPSGYALALHIQFTTAKFLFQTYPKEWLDLYSQQGLVMSDPTVAWGFENTGFVLWSDLRESDGSGVLDKAAQYGMKFGVTCAVERDDSRSFASFSRNDREFEAAECAKLVETVSALHDATADKAHLDPETVQRLKNMSIMVTHPGS